MTLPPDHQLAALREEIRDAAKHTVRVRWFLFLGFSAGILLFILLRPGGPAYPPDLGGDLPPGIMMGVLAVLLSVPSALIGFVISCLLGDLFRYAHRRRLR